MPPKAASSEDTAGVVSGKVLHPDGTPVEGAEVRLFTGIYTGGKCDFSWLGVSSKRAGTEARYGWDYVLRNAGSRIIAIEPETEEFRSLQFQIARHGQRLNVNIVFLGRGTLQGRTFDEGSNEAPDGSPLTE